MRLDALVDLLADALSACIDRGDFPAYCAQECFEPRLRITWTPDLGAWATVRWIHSTSVTLDRPADKAAA